MEVVHFKTIDNEAVVNITGYYKEAIHKLLATIAINLATSSVDKAYQLELLKFTVDVEKVVSGRFGNLLMQSILKNFLKSIDHKVVFPLEAVRIA